MRRDELVSITRFVEGHAGYVRQRTGKPPHAGRLARGYDDHAGRHGLLDRGAEPRRPPRIRGAEAEVDEASAVLGRPYDAPRQRFGSRGERSVEHAHDHEDRSGHGGPVANPVDDVCIDLSVPADTNARHGPVTDVRVGQVHTAVDDRHADALSR
jgi:hypothetical protein